MKPQGPEGVRTLGHREYVGGMWDQIGRLQLDFLLSAGLSPHHYLLDIGCGALRGGVHLIRYLDAGHYLGMEKEAELLEAGIDELGVDLYEQQVPLLIASDRFDVGRFGIVPDVAIAQSLFTHLPPLAIRTCLANLRRVMPAGSFFATFFETAAPVQNPLAPHDHASFRYTPQEMRDFGAGWAMTYIGDWGHPRGQVMVEYVPC
jgi:hypothetical protein